MKTIERLPSKLDLAEKRYQEAKENAHIYPSNDNDQWLFWSKGHYEVELKKAEKREAAILKDLNSADHNQGRLPEKTVLSEGTAFISLLLLGATVFILWLLR